jgi:VCBS repeat-containing protein
VPAPGVLANDGDPDDGCSTLTAVSASALSPAGAGSLTLNANGSFTFTPAANVNTGGGAPVTFTYRAQCGAVLSAPATVSIAVAAVNDPPTISNIVDQTIYRNGTAGPIAFTIGDVEDVSSATLSGTSSNTTLVPGGNILFGGSGASRTVTVTPAANQVGTATITVRVTDNGGAQATDTFILTVLAPPTLVGVQNVPTTKAANAGSAVSMIWKYNNGSTTVDSSAVTQRVTVTGVSVNVNYSNTDPGGSGFRYDPTTKQWSFNLQTKDSSGRNYAAGTYTVTITPLATGWTGTSFPLTLK